MMKLSSNNVMTPGAAIPTVIYRIGEVSIPHLINVAKKKDKLASDSATKILGEIATDKALAALGELAEVASLSEIANSALGEASFRRKHRERLEKRSKFMLFKRRT
jgi:hypothetical protein